MALKSLDSMLVSVGGPLPAPTPLTVPDPRAGVHFILVDNTWNTNYPEWYPFIESATATAFPATATETAAFALLSSSHERQRVLQYRYTAVIGLVIASYM